MPVKGVTSGRKEGLRYHGTPVVGFIHKGRATKIAGKKGAKLEKLPYFVFDTPQTREVGDHLHKQQPDAEYITEMPIKFPQALFAHGRGRQMTAEGQIQSVLDAWMMRRVKGYLACMGDGEWVRFHEPKNGDPWPPVRDGYVVGEWDKAGEFVLPEVNVDTGEQRWRVRCSREECPWRQWAFTDGDGQIQQRERLSCGLGGVLMFEVRGFYRYAGVYALKLSGLATQFVADQLDYIVRSCGQLWDKSFALHWTPIQYHHPKWGPQEFHAPRLSPAQGGDKVGAKQAMADLFGDDSGPTDFSSLTPAAAAFPNGLVAEGEVDEDLLDMELAVENSDADHEYRGTLFGPDVGGGDPSGGRR